MMWWDNVLTAGLANEPQRTSRSRYDEACAVLLDSWLGMATPPIAIYRLGRIGVPGVSDLDFVLVMPDRPIDWAAMEPSEYEPWIRELMVHPPYVCGTSAWPYLDGWLPTFDLELLEGEDLLRLSPPPDVGRGLALGMLVDYLIAKLPVDILAAARAPTVNVRGLLGVLHSMRYMQKLADDAGVVWEPALDASAERVDQLRREWLDLDESTRRTWLSETARGSVDAVEVLAGAVDGLLQHVASGTRLTLPYQRSIVGRRFEMHFGPDSGFADNDRRTRGCIPERVGDVWVHPPSYLAVLAAYAQWAPQLGRFLFGRRPPPYLFADTAWEPGLKYHALAMESYLHDAKVLGVPPLKYVALGYSPLRSYPAAVADYVGRLARGESHVAGLPRAFAQELRRRRMHR